jgi:hypothetical protein
MATHVYLARWVWNATLLQWESPLKAQCTGAIDFRSNTQCGTAGGTGGWGFFSYPTTVTISGSTYLGADFAAITNTRKTAINTNLGVALTVNESLDKVINKLLTLNGVADGSTKWRPLRIGKTRAIDIRFAGLSLGIGTVQDDQAEFLASMNVRKADYARLKASGVAIETLRKWNGYDLIKYWGTRDSSKLAAILPPESINDGSDPPETTISDNFSGTLGNWTQVQGTWSIVSGGAQTSTATVLNYMRYNTSLSSDDHKAAVDTAAHGVNGTMGPAVRCSADADPNEDYYSARMDAAGNIEFAKVVNGTLTGLDTTKTVTASTPDTIQVECSDSAMVSRFNGVTQHNFTDTSLTGNLQCGAVSRRSGDRIDNFSAEDLAVAVAYISPPRTMQPFLAQ